MDEFYKYVRSFYGQQGLYPMGATLRDIKAVTGIYLAREATNFEGDSIDREYVRDILINDLGYVWLAKKLKGN